MSAPPYMKLYVADYLGDTHHLGALEHGAYLLLLMGMWRAGGTLPAADANLARLARCTTEEWSQIKDVILPFFTRSRGKLTHGRLSRELAKYETVSGKRSEAGKQGASKKASKNNMEAKAIASNAESNCTHNQNQNHIDITPPTPQEGGQGDDLFGEKPIDEETSSRRKPKRAIPADCPTADQIEAAQAEARKAGADVDMAYQAQRFRNWALAKDARYADWSRTWVNWSIKAIADAPKRPSLVATNTAAPSADDIAARWDRRVADYRRAWTWNEVDFGPRPGREGCKAPAWILEKHGYATKTGDAA